MLLCHRVYRLPHSPPSPNLHVQMSSDCGISAMAPAEAPEASWLAPAIVGQPQSCRRTSQQRSCEGRLPACNASLPMRSTPYGGRQCCCHGLDVCANSTAIRLACARIGTVQVYSIRSPSMRPSTARRSVSAAWARRTTGPWGAVQGRACKGRFVRDDSLIRHRGRPAAGVITHRHTAIAATGPSAMASTGVKPASSFQNAVTVLLLDIRCSPDADRVLGSPFGQESRSAGGCSR